MSGQNKTKKKKTTLTQDKKLVLKQAVGTGQLTAFRVMKKSCVFVIIAIHFQTLTGHNHFLVNLSTVDFSTRMSAFPHPHSSCPHPLRPVISILLGSYSNGKDMLKLMLLMGDNGAV